MHTSTRLCAGDFHYWRQGPTGAQEVDFAAFCPEYHHQDRVGVVSLALEQGVLETSYAILALTTAFYDCLRASHEHFFDYPQHFAFVGEELPVAGGALAPQLRVGQTSLLLNTPQVWDAWSWLDVWPEAKWVTAPATTEGMLRRVFDYQINRLFWPCSLKPLEQAALLPDHLWQMLKTSVKSVYLYGKGDSSWAGLAGECMEIRVEAAVTEIVRESIEQLPALVLTEDGVDVGQVTSRTQVFERVDVQRFLSMLEGEV